MRRVLKLQKTVIGISLSFFALFFALSVFSMFAKAATDLTQTTILSPTAANQATVSDQGGTEIQIDGYGFGEVKSNEASKISAKDDTFCAINSGNLFCWGKNHYGQLGNDDLASSSVPLKVLAKNGVVDSFWTGVSVLGDSVCGINMGDVYCWGDFNSSKVPLPVQALSNNGFVDENIVRYDGAVCSVDSGTTPSEIICADRSGALVNTIQFTAESNPQISKISADSSSLCAIVSSNLYCLGSNSNLGLSSTTPSLIAGTGSSISGSVNEVSLNGNVACFSIHQGSTDEMYCWGSNSSVQLGFQNALSSTSPTTQVDFTQKTGTTANVSYRLPAISSVHSISVSLLSVCAVVDVEVYNGSGYDAASPQTLCWGSDSDNQLGQNYRNFTNAEVSTMLSPHSVFPGLVSSPTSSAEVALGTYSACARNLSDNKISCWGSDNYGQLATSASETMRSADCQTGDINHATAPYCSVWQQGSSVSGSAIPVVIDSNFFTKPTVLLGTDPCDVEQFSDILIICKYSPSSVPATTGTVDLSVNSTTSPNSISVVSENFTWRTPSSSELTATYGIEFSLPTLASSSGGTNFYVDGTLPTGLAISNDGVISGTSNDTPGNYDFKVCAMSALGQLSCSSDIRLVLKPGPKITTTQSSFSVYKAQNNNVILQGVGFQSLRWSVLDNTLGNPGQLVDDSLTDDEKWQDHLIDFNLPDGLYLSSTTGEITGEVDSDEVAGDYAVRIALIAGDCSSSCVDNTPLVVDYKDITIKVVDGPQITTEELPDATKNSQYDLRIQTTNPWQKVIQIQNAGTILPAGLSIVGSKLTGTPTVSGTYSISLKACSNNNEQTPQLVCGETKTFTLNIISSSTDTITLNTTLPAAVYGEHYSQQLTTSSNTFPLINNCVLANSAEPIVDDKQLIQSNLYLLVDECKVEGTIKSNTPNFQFSVVASNGIATSSVQDFNVSIDHSLKILTSSLPDGIQNSANYSVEVSVAGDLSSLQSISILESGFSVSCSESSKKCQITATSSLPSAASTTITLQAIWNADASTSVSKQYTVNLNSGLYLNGKSDYTVLTRTIGEITAINDYTVSGATSVSVFSSSSCSSSSKYPSWILVEQPSSTSAQLLKFVARSSVSPGDYCFGIRATNGSTTIDKDINLKVVDIASDFSTTQYVTLGTTTSIDLNDEGEISNWVYNSSARLTDASGNSYEATLSALQTDGLTISGTKNELLSAVFSNDTFTTTTGSQSNIVRITLSGTFTNLTINSTANFTINFIILPTNVTVSVNTDQDGGTDPNKFEFEIGGGSETFPTAPKITATLSVIYGISPVFLQYNDAECSWPIWFTVSQDGRFSALDIPEARSGCVKVLVRVQSYTQIEKINYVVSGKPTLTVQEQTLPFDQTGAAKIFMEAKTGPINWSFNSGITPTIGASACPASITASIANQLEIMFGASWRDNCYEYVVDSVPYYNYGPITFDNTVSTPGSQQVDCPQLDDCESGELHLKPLSEGDFKVKIRATRTGAGTSASDFTEDFFDFHVSQKVEIDPSCQHVVPALTNPATDCDNPSQTPRTIPESDNMAQYQQPLIVTGDSPQVWISDCVDPSGSHISGIYDNPFDQDFPYLHPELGSSFAPSCIGISFLNQELVGTVNIGSGDAGIYKLTISATNAFTPVPVSREFSIDIRSKPVFSAATIYTQVSQIVNYPLNVTGSKPIALSLTSGLNSLPSGVLLCGTESDLVNGFPDFSVSGNKYVKCTGSTSSISSFVGATVPALCDFPDSNTVDDTSKPFCKNTSGSAYDLYVKCSPTTTSGMPLCESFSIFGKPTSSGTYPLNLAASNSVDSVSATVQVVVDSPPHFTTSATLSNALIGSAYSENVNVTGGGNVTSMAVTSTSLSEVQASPDVSELTCDNPPTGSSAYFTAPAGFQITNSGEISIANVVAPAGYYCFKITAQSQLGPISQIAQIFVMSVPKIELTTLPNGRVGVQYKGAAKDQTEYYPCYGDTNCSNVNLNISSSIPVIWNVTNDVANGSVNVPGLYFDSNNNLVGTPTQAGTYNLKIYATSQLGRVDANLTLVVEQKPQITATGALDEFFPTHASVGTAYTSENIPVVIYPTSHPVSVTVSPRATGCLVGDSMDFANICTTGLPAGMSMSNTGLTYKISGTPTESGVFKFTLTPSSSFKPAQCSNSAFAAQEPTTCQVLGSGATVTAVLIVDAPVSFNANGFSMPEGFTGIVYSEKIPFVSTTSPSFEIVSSPSSDSSCQGLVSGLPSGAVFDSSVPGLSLSSADGILSGAPTASGEYHICLRGQNTFSTAWVYTWFKLVVSGPPEFDSSQATRLPDAVMGESTNNLSINLRMSGAPQISGASQNVFIGTVRSTNNYTSNANEIISLNNSISSQLNAIGIQISQCIQKDPITLDSVQSSSTFDHQVMISTNPQRRYPTTTPTCFVVFAKNSSGIAAKVFVYDIKSRPVIDTSELAAWQNNLSGYSDTVFAHEKRFTCSLLPPADQPSCQEPEPNIPPSETISFSSPDLQTVLGSSMQIDSATGEISGTPSVSSEGVHQVTIVATNTSGFSATKQIPVEILNAPILDLPNHNWKIDNAKYMINYSYQFNVKTVGNAANVSLSIPASDLPAGLTFDAATKTISGVPTQVANNPCLILNVTVSENSDSRIQEVELCVLDSPPILQDASGVQLTQSQILQQGGLNIDYELQLQADGNTNGEGDVPNGMKWEITSGNLPPGISLTEFVDSTGAVVVNKILLKGVPTLVGTFYFELAAYNSICNPTLSSIAEAAGEAALNDYYAICKDSKRNLLITIDGSPKLNQPDYPTLFLGEEYVNDSNEPTQFSGITPIDFRLGYVDGTGNFVADYTFADADDLCTKPENWDGNPEQRLIIPGPTAKANGTNLPPCFALDRTTGNLAGISNQYLSDPPQDSPLADFNFNGLIATNWLEGSDSSDNIYSFTLQASNRSGKTVVTPKVEITGSPKIRPQDLIFAILGQPYEDSIKSYGLDPLKYQIAVQDQSGTVSSADTYLSQFGLHYQCSAGNPDHEPGSIFTDTANGETVQYGANGEDVVDFIAIARNDADCSAPLPSPIQTRGIISPTSGFDAAKMHINIYELPSGQRSLPDAQVGVHYAVALKPIGSAPVEFFPNTDEACLALGPECVDLKTVSSSIPNGMYFTKDGVLQGVPDKEGDYTFKVDSKNIAGYNEQTMTLHVLPAPEMIYSDSESGLFTGKDRSGNDFNYSKYKFDSLHDKMFDSLLGKYGHNLSDYASWKNSTGVDDRSRGISALIAFILRFITLILLVVLTIATFICIHQFNRRYKVFKMFKKDK